MEARERRAEQRGHEHESEEGGDEGGQGEEGEHGCWVVAITPVRAEKGYYADEGEEGDASG